jgi:nitrous oxidase accessory protein
MRYLLGFLLLLNTNVFAKTITVCATCEVKTIAAGVALAEDGDTVLVKSGTYNEVEININKAIHLKGEGMPVLDAQNKTKSILAITATGFTISGFKFVNVGMSYTKEVAAVFTTHCEDFFIQDNVVENCFYAFMIQRGHSGLLKNNKIIGNAVNETSSGNGFHVWKSVDMNIENNTIHGMRDGIYLEHVTCSVVFNNISESNIRYGLHFMFSHDNDYYGNEFKKNGAGVAVMFSKRVNMHHNTFHFNWGTASYGLLLKEIYDAEIYDNVFEQNTIGINIDGCNRINYINNRFVRNGWALKFTGGCYTNIFKTNDFLHNAFDLSYNSRVNDNKFTQNYWSEYSGYDLDKDGVGDVPHRPVKLFSYVVNRTPESLVLLHSLFVDIINFSEKISPVFTPDNLKDNEPLMNPFEEELGTNAISKKD